MLFSELCLALAKLEKTTSRNAITQILGEIFSRTSASEIDLVCYLALGRLGPLYESLEFQLAEKMVLRALAQGFAVPEEKVRREYKKIGDLGEVTEKVKSQKLKLQPSPRLRPASKTTTQNAKLSVLDVYRKLRGIAEEHGEGSQQRKLEGLIWLLQTLDASSVKFVVRMVLGRLRLGFSDMTVLDALSFMEAGDKSLRPALEQAYFVQADIGAIARLFKRQGLHGLRGITAQLGVPVMPALCQRLKTADEMIEKMETVAVEPKYDGQRVQIHYRKDKSKEEWGVRAFTRNLEEVSFMFPELIEIGSEIRAERVILDSEAVGYDAKSGKILPFQEIITRKRKHAISEAAGKVPLTFFVFDILYLDGKSLLHLPLSQRADYLEAVVRGGNVLARTQRIVTKEARALRDFHRRQLEAGLEGAVVKKWNAPYVPGRRGWSWVKFKELEEKAAGLSDTLDCVVMGYYRGRGKRAGFGIGGFLVGVWDRERLVTISKIGTGLSDDQWRELRRRGDAALVREKPKEYGEVEKALAPDVWIAPEIVVEIAADNITKSPVHSAGLALRFPRLVRFRGDKSPAQATTLAEVRRLFRMQHQ